jgi:hypothetical protein
MSFPIIAGVVLTGLGAFLGGMVVSAWGALLVLRNVSHHSSRLS